MTYFRADVEIDFLDITRLFKAIFAIRTALISIEKLIKITSLNDVVYDDVVGLIFQLKIRRQ